MKRLALFAVIALSVAAQQRQAPSPCPGEGKFKLFTAEKLVYRIDTQTGKTWIHVHGFEGGIGTDGYFDRLQKTGKPPTLEEEFGRIVSYWQPIDEAPPPVKPKQH